MVGGRVQHQDFFLETPKEREQMAKKLCGMAVEMQRSFRAGIEGNMKKFWGNRQGGVSYAY